MVSVYTYILPQYNNNSPEYSSKRVNEHVCHAPFCVTVKLEGGAHKRVHAHDHVVRRGLSVTELI